MLSRPSVRTGQRPVTPTALRESETGSLGMLVLIFGLSLVWYINPSTSKFGSAI